VINRTKLLRHYYDAGFGTKEFPAQVNLAAHSMGGMIVTGYLQKNGQDKVNKIATIATPFRGSLESVAKTALGVAALGTTPGSPREREAARVTPALYYLLPSFAGAVIADPGLKDDIFVPEAWQPGIIESLESFFRMYGLDQSKPDQQALALLEAMLNAAWKYRTRMERLQLQNSKDWLSLVGVDETTRVTMRITKDAKGAPRFDLADGDVRNDWEHTDPAQHVYTGDNTVPYLGARAKFIPVEQVVCLIPKDFSFWELKDRLLENTGFHSTLPNMNLCQRLVVSHFKGEMYGDVWGRPAPDLPEGVKWDPPIAGLKEMKG
jgi:alpha/beta hydrolase fold.